MSVVIETTIGDITVDLYIEERPRTCLNFLKLCKMKYYNFNTIFSVQRNFIAQMGDPTGTGQGGDSLYSQLFGDQARFYEGEKNPIIKHHDIGTVSMVNCGDDHIFGSQFFITLGQELDSLDNVHLVFGKVAEGMDVVMKLNEAISAEDNRPYKDIFITHTVILNDPFPDPEGFTCSDKSPEPSREIVDSLYTAVCSDGDDNEGLSGQEITEQLAAKEAEARAVVLEMVGDLPDAELAPPENILFVCKLNPVTTSEDLMIIFSRFGKINSCEVITDQKTGNSLQYSFIEFAETKSCEDAYFKMDNVLIDERRIHVDFSQSVSKIKWKGKGKIEYYDDDGERTNANTASLDFNTKKGALHPDKGINRHKRAIRSRSISNYTEKRRTHNSNLNIARESPRSRRINASPDNRRNRNPDPDTRKRRTHSRSSSVNRASAKHRSSGTKRKVFSRRISSDRRKCRKMSRNSSSDSEQHRKVSKNRSRKSANRQTRSRSVSTERKIQRCRKSRNEERQKRMRSSSVSSERHKRTHSRNISIIQKHRRTTRSRSLSPYIKQRRRSRSMSGERRRIPSSSSSSYRKKRNVQSRSISNDRRNRKGISADKGRRQIDPSNSMPDRNSKIVICSSRRRERSLSYTDESSLSTDRRRKTKHSPDRKTSRTDDYLERRKISSNPLADGKIKVQHSRSLKRESEDLSENSDKELSEVHKRKYDKKLMKLLKKDIKKIKSKSHKKKSKKKSKKKKQKSSSSDDSSSS